MIKINILMDSVLLSEDAGGETQTQIYSLQIDAYQNYYLKR